MANDLTFNQISTVLQAIYQQATGETAIAPQNTAEFVTIGQELLMTGYDNLMGAVSQVMARTIFANRPYTRKFKDLEATEMEYGNHVRKLSVIDKDFEDNKQMPLTEGQSVDDQVIRKPAILQLNFYGKEAWGDHVTIFRNQINDAFQSPDQLSSFVALYLQNVSDMLEQGRETLARSTVANLITGTIAAGNPNQVVHLLTEYNAQSGQSLTATSIYAPDNFAPFMRWCFARIATVSSMLTERSRIFHQNVTGKEVQRHTPKELQRAYLYAPTQYNIEAQVLATTFNEQYLKGVKGELVNFWQNINTPGQIKATASYLKPDGTVGTTDPTTTNNIFGVIMDRDAAGYNIYEQTAESSRYNAAGKYQNTWFSEVRRYWVDPTENAVVLLLD